MDKANDIDLTKYALKTDNAPTATKLQAARGIALSGAVTGSVSSDFGGNVTISTTLANFDASKIASGTISIDRLPKAALERLVVVADDTARFALTTATAQSGDTVKVASTGKMYLIKDESKLSSEDGYEPYTASQASSVPWSGVTGKPSTFTPPTSSATVLGGIKVGYTTSGKNYKVQLDSFGNAYVNVPWTDNNTTYNEATADTLGLVKIGYASNGKNYAVLLANGKMYVNVPWTDSNTTYTQATSDNLGLVKIGYSANGKNYPVALDGNGKMYVNVPWTDTNTTYGVVGANGSTGLVKNGSTVTNASGYTACPIVGGIPYYKDTNTTYANMKAATASAAAEVVRSDSPNASVQKTGGNVTITGKSNSTKLTFAVMPAEENGLTLQLPADYTAAGKTTANVTIDELTATLKVTAAGGQTANVTVTQAAGDSTIELDKKTINLDVNGTQQTVNVTSNDSWTWAQAAARTVLRMMER